MCNQVQHLYSSCTFVDILSKYIPSEISLFCKEALKSAANKLQKAAREGNLRAMQTLNKGDKKMQFEGLKRSLSNDRVIDRKNFYCPRV